MMRTQMTTALVAALVLGTPAPAQQAAEAATGKIAWQHDLEQALAQSGKDGRPVIAYFTFDT